MNSAVAVERRACLPFPPFFWNVARYETDFFCLIWQECLWLDVRAWCKSPKPFVPVPSKPNHIQASECLYTQVYGETFKQQRVFGFWALAALMADSLSNFDYIMCQHITTGGHFCPFWCSDKKIGNMLNNFDHIKLYVIFFSAKAVCVSFYDHWNSFVYSNFVLALNHPEKNLYGFLL